MTDLSRTNPQVQPVLRRLLPTLVPLLSLLGAGVGLIVWQQYRANMNERISAVNTEIAADFQATLKQQASGLATALLSISTDPRVHQALIAGDSALLLRNWHPVFADMSRQYGVTHFYFLDRARTCILRVHKPEKRGDRIDRFTAQEAERRDRTSWGIELGPMGTLTLRVVQPVFQNNTLLGYVELGKEIEDVMQQLHAKSGRHVAITLHKRYLTQAGWEEGMRLLGRASHWNQHPRSVTAYSSLTPLPDAFAVMSHDITHHDAEKDHIHDQSNQDIPLNGKTWRLSVSPLQDVSGQEVGDLMVMSDISAAQQAFHRLIVSSSLIGGTLLLLLLGFIMVLLRRTDTGIRTQQAALRASEERLSCALQGANDGLWDWNMETDEVYYSPRWLEMLGYRPGELAETFDTWAMLVHPEDKARALKEVESCMAGQTDQLEVEFRMRHKAGHWVDVLSRARLASDTRTQRLVGTHMDISERKQIQLALQRQVAFTESLIDAEVDGVAVCHALDTPPYNCFTVWNRAMFDLTGLTQKEVNLHGCYQSMFTDVAEQQRIRQRMARVFRGEHLIDDEWHIAHKDGKPRTVRVHTTFVTAQTGERHVLMLMHDITRLHAARQELLGREASWRGLFNNAIEAIYIMEADGRFIDVNAAAVAMYGHPREWLIGKTPAEISAPGHNDLHALQASFVRVLAGEPQRFEFWGIRANGEHFPKEVYMAPSLYFGRQVMIAMARDISERKQAEDNLRLAASVFSHAREGIMITTPDGTILDINDAFTEITGYTREDTIGHNPRFLNSGKQGLAFYTAMWEDLRKQGHWHGEIWNRRKNGEIFAEMLTISAIRNDEGQVLRYVAMFSDITPFKEHQRQLEHIAHYDALTGLPNRVLLADRLHQAMAQTQRRGTVLAVAYLDLDGFKAINDSHGHDMGDKLLSTVSVRMKQGLREIDTIARLGGDEFVAVLLDLDTPQACAPMLDRLLAAAAEPVWVDTVELRVSASLGVAFFPQAEEIDPDQLLRQADQAMYQAKLSGKNRYHIFDADQDRNVRGHHESLEHIRQAMAEREFVLYYQPKVNMHSGEVIGAEALIRWQHPERGMLPPAMFLPVIEGHPLSIELGEWVLDTALTQIETWKAGGLTLPVSVNIDAQQLQSPDFVARLRELLAAHPGVQAGELELEVLETSALEDVAHVSDVILACRNIGIGFALDDFGTGYSSLTYLKRLPAGQLKIDQSFVRDMLDDPEDLAILEGVLGLASAFRRQVIAEGVETLAHGEMLLRLGCELGQGYAIAYPMPASAIPEWLSTWHPDPGWLNQLAANHNDLPILFGVVEHRAWVVSVSGYIQGTRNERPTLDSHQCRFGQWLNHDGLARFGHSLPFAKVLQLHRDIHDLAGELLDLKHDGYAELALARLDTLLDLRDALLKQLIGLLTHRTPT